MNRTGKMAPEHRRLWRYSTMTLPEICALPVEEVATPTAHLYLWVPNALLLARVRNRTYTDKDTQFDLTALVGKHAPDED